MNKNRKITTETKTKEQKNFEVCIGNNCLTMHSFHQTQTFSSNSEEANTDELLKNEGYLIKNNKSLNKILIERCFGLWQKICPPRETIWGFFFSLIYEYLFK